MVPVVWEHGLDAARCRKAIEGTNEAIAPFFAVHRRALMRILREARAIIAEFWADRAAFPLAAGG